MDTSRRFLSLSLVTYRMISNVSSMLLSDGFYLWDWLLLIDIICFVMVTSRRFLSLKLITIKIIFNALEFCFIVKKENQNICRINIFHCNYQNICRRNIFHCNYQTVTIFWFGCYVINKVKKWKSKHRLMVLSF